MIKYKHNNVNLPYIREIKKRRKKNMKAKKLVVVLLVALLIVVGASCLAACDGGGTTVKIWVSELAGVKESFQKQIEAFNKSQDDYKIEAEISGMTEGDAATMMIADVEGGPDVFCFAQDQLTRLINAGALQALGNEAKAAVIANNDAGAVACATSGDKIYAYPLTADNGYFMFYDKSVINESSLGSLDALLADCNAQNKKFSFNVGDSGWYGASFFFGAGCVSEWGTDDEGTFTSVNDTFNSANGMIAMKGLSALMNNTAYKDSSSTGDFAQGSAVVISGTWGVNDAKVALVDNYGVAKLPSYTVDGVDYQLGSFTGCKLMGIKPSQDLEKSKALQALVTYLTNKENQLARFTEFGWGPSNKEAQADPAVAADEALQALAAQNVHSVPQGNIHGSWWDAAKALAAGAFEANGDEAKLQEALTAYQNTVNTLADPNAVIPDWTVIGHLMGADWATGEGKEFVMKNAPVGSKTYVSQPLYFVEGDEFKVRYAYSWDVQIGDNGENIAAPGEGLYMVKIDSDALTYEFIEASFGICGGFNDWSADEAMTYDAESNSYKGTVTTTADNVEFKVRVNGGWDYFDYGKDGGNYTLETAGTYQVSISFDLEQMSWIVSAVAQA